VLLGIVATALLHLLLMAPLVFAGHAPDRRTHELGAEMSGVPAMTVVSLDEESELGLQHSVAHDARIAPTRLLLPVGALELQDAAVPVDVGDDSSAQSSASEQTDSQQRALMFGRYLGQVTARVDRAWLRPRTPVGAATFTCIVQVEQDGRGTVKEVMLKTCNGTTAWQLSLVRAIESASPFPAPPDPAVFSPTLTFEMSAEAFREGAAADGYEPVFSKPAKTVADGGGGYTR
jgi:hypothetical protein